MKTKVGVVIGRFQVHEIHEGHMSLLNYVRKQHDRMIIMLGIKPTPAHQKNPLDYRTRENMLRELFPDVIVLPLADSPSDDIWSQNIDKLIDSIYMASEAVLYGGRDSFIPYYHGRHETKEIEFGSEASSTEFRQRIVNNPINSADFRAGIIYATGNLLPRIYKAVDIAMLRRNKDNEIEVILGRKASENKFRFPGGHVDMNDYSLEDAARREFSEEVIGPSIEHKLQYLCSVSVADWRSEGCEDVKYMTTLFATWYTWGGIKAGDDLHEVAWFNPWKVDIIETHDPLLQRLKEAIYNGEIKG